MHGTKHSSSYIPGLDGIRAIAFLLVFWAHGTPGPISHYIPATLGVMQDAKRILVAGDPEFASQIALLR